MYHPANAIPLKKKQYELICVGMDGMTKNTLEKAILPMQLCICILSGGEGVMDILWNHKIHL